MTAGPFFELLLLSSVDLSQLRASDQPLGARRSRREKRHSLDMEGASLNQLMSRKKREHSFG